ncbi:MAG: 5'-3' exonuclease H3TH domain-containing protein [Candidatus Paceibacterota bacterium]
MTDKTQPKKEVLVIIDSNSIIHRAYHALPPLTTKKGELVNAVYGFLLVFLKAVKDFHPEFIAAAFDLPFPTFRHKKYDEYKAKRPPTPEDLRSQMSVVKEFLKVFSVPIFEKEGYEADDIVGTIAQKSARTRKSLEIIILSGDLDSLQLVGPRTKVYALKKGIKDVILYDEEQVKERFQGLSPEQILDFKSLRGDPSDNIPGVKGIGEKTAIELLSKFGSLENIYKKIEKTPGDFKKNTKELLVEYKDQAFLSKFLVQLEKNVPIDFNLENCMWLDFNEKEASHLLEKFEFYSLIKRLPELKKREEKPVRENLRLL